MNRYSCDVPNRLLVGLKPSKSISGRDLSSYSTSVYDDAYGIFTDIGYLVISNLILFSRPCTEDGFGHSADLEYDTFEDPGSLSIMGNFFISTAESITSSSKNVRDYFPETWLFQMEMTGPDGVFESQETLPDTITEWEGSAVCINSKDGLGLSDTASIKGFQAFFISYNLPISVIRGEEFVVTATIFSYVDAAIPVISNFLTFFARKNRRQTAGEIARHTTQATGRPISRFTVARRLHGGGLFARRPVRCVPLTPAHRRRRSLWCREHRNWRDNEWGRVLFTDDSRFSLSSDSHRILIWRERGSRNHPSNIIERDRYGGRGVLVWEGIMLRSRTDLHIFDAGSVNGTRYCNENLLPYVRLFRGAMGLQFLFMDDNAPCHRTVAAEHLLESEDIERMDWLARSPDLNPIEHVWDFLGRRLAARTLPPVTIRELRLALQDEWTAMPQELIDTLILSMFRRCETCLAVTVSLDKPQGFVVANDSTSGVLCVQPNSSNGIELKLKATKVGKVNITVRAETISSSKVCGNSSIYDASARDAITQSFGVEPGGFPNEKVHSILVCPSGINSWILYKEVTGKSLRGKNIFNNSLQCCVVRVFTKGSTSNTQSKVDTTEESAQMQKRVHCKDFQYRNKTVDTCSDCVKYR
ncbi:transposable element Tcb2 transposase [Trichonephila clavipes]|nr:transposable element Tcb2 transposase [Trichonephila clavipes]